MIIYMTQLEMLVGYEKAIHAFLLLLLFFFKVYFALQRLFVYSTAL